MDMVKFASRDEASSGYMRVLELIATINIERLPSPVNVGANTMVLVKTQDGTVIELCCRMRD